VPPFGWTQSIVPEVFNWSSIFVRVELKWRVWLRSTRVADVKDTVTNFVSPSTFCCLGLLDESFIKYYVFSLGMDYDESLENLKNFKMMSHMFSRYLFSVMSRSLNVLASADFLVDFTVLAAMQWIIKQEGSYYQTRRSSVSIRLCCNCCIIFQWDIENAKRLKIIRFVS